MSDSFASQFEDDFGDNKSAAKPLVAPASSAHPTNPTMAAAFTRSYPEKCPDCRGTGRFTSWSGRDVGQCFKCKGKGELMFKTSREDREKNRTQAATRKTAQAQTAWNDFVMQHEAEAAWIMREKDGFDFARSMYEAILKFGSLTPNQLAACTRAVERVEARKAAAVARIETAPVVDMAKIEKAFSTASGEGLKAPKLLIGALVLSPAKATSDNAGAIYVKGGKGFDAPYFGKIMGGKFLKSRDCDAATEALILEAAKDPLAAAIAYGKATGVCACCGRELTNALSIELGIGPICRAKWGWGE